jgi:oxygen-independent coproporphyrinogen-3 oxidase
MTTTNNGELGIYIHIPFCKSKCIYCDFVSVTDIKLIEKYFSYLVKEIEMYKDILKNSKIITIYIGGGTPSYVHNKYIEKIIMKIKEYNDLSDVLEFTIEVNPGTVDKEKLSAYKKIGINRISIGLQSTNNKMLKMLGRIHDYEEFVESYELARQVGFKNISIDLMFGLPNQTIEIFNESIDKVIKLKPEHISAYSLNVEKTTRLYEMIQKGVLPSPSEEIDRLMYNHLITKLEKNGYYLYEISNFSKIGFESKHNLVYWKRKNYLGLGIAAHGFVDDKRYGNERSFINYFNKIDEFKKPISEFEEIDNDESLFEEIMLGLRLSKGINYKEINKKYNIDFLGKLKNEIIELKKEELIEINGDFLRVTKKGMSVSNSIIVKLTF